MKGLPRTPETHASPLQRCLFLHKRGIIRLSREMLCGHFIPHSIGPDDVPHVKRTLPVISGAAILLQLKKARDVGSLHSFA